MASRRRFTKEFKQEAVRLVLEKRVTMSQVARGRRGDGCVGLSGAEARHIGRPELSHDHRHTAGVAHRVTHGPCRDRGAMSAFTTRCSTSVTCGVMCV